MGIIISIIINIFVPNLAKTGCDAILSQIPQELLNLGMCECDLSIGGLVSIDLNAKAICKVAIPDTTPSQSCDFIVTGKGDGVGFALGSGEAYLNVNTSCDFGPGNVNFSADGSFTRSGVVDVTGCTIDGLLDNGEKISCSQCAIGCGGEFSASVTCTRGATTILNGQCLDFTKIATTIIDAVN